MFKGYNAWDVCEGNVTVSNPNACACSIASRVTWDPWPSKMNICLFVGEIPPNIDLLKKERKSLKINVVIHAFDCIAIHVPSLQKLNVVISCPPSFENVKPWQCCPNYINNTINNQPFPGLGNGVIHLLRTSSCQNPSSCLSFCLDVCFIIIPDMI